MNPYTCDFTKLKPVSYNRKSSEAEDKQVLSITTQIEEAERIASYYKLSSFITVFKEAKSAKKEFMRPEFTRMIEMIENGEADTIVCWKLDRLARNMTEGGRIIDLISSGVIKAIITHDKVYYPWDNVLLMAIEFGIANQYVKDLSVNVKRGQRKKATMGIPHGVATLGFLNDRSEEKGNRKWIIDELRLKSIKILFDMFLTGNYSAGKLHRYATQKLKLTTVKRKRIGGNLISPSRIYQILKDPIYAGFFIQNGERYELADYLPRLITEDQHNKVKNLLAKKNIPKSQNNSATFAGYIRSENGDFIGQDVKFQLICDCKHKFAYLNRNTCPKCNKEIDQLENPKYLNFTYYYNVKNKKAREKYKYLSETKVNDEVLDFIDNYLTFSESLATWSKKYIKELKNIEINKQLILEQKAKDDLSDFERKKSRLRQMLRDEHITDSEYKNDLKSLNEQYKCLPDKNSSVDWAERMNEIIDLTLSAKVVMGKGSMEAKRNILSKLGSNLIWDDKELFIYNDIAVNKLVKCIKDIKLEFPKFEPKNYVVKQAPNEKIGLSDPIFSRMLPGQGSNLRP